MHKHLIQWLSGIVKCIKLHEPSTAIAAIATAISLVAAFFAWQQIEVADDTAKRSLRAYVSARPVEPFARISDDNAYVTLFFELKNVGQTPARLNASSARIFVHRYPYGSDQFELPTYESAVPLNTSPAYFGKEESSIRPFKNDKGFTPDDIIAAQEGKTKRLVISGRYFYLDIYGRQWHIDICRVYSGKDFTHVQLCKQGEAAK